MSLLSSFSLRVRGARSPLSLAVAAGLLCGPAYAATDAQTPTTLDQVVVTASRIEQRAVDAPASVSVITRADLEQQPFASLQDALRSVEGVSVVGAGANKLDISLRGMPGKYSLILVDGRRQGSRETLNREELGPVQASQIPPLQAIERIEVVRGPMSSLYGSDAIGGVVNIITRRPSNDWTGAMDLDVTVQEDSSLGNSRGANAYLAGPLQPDLLSLQLFGKSTRRSEADVFDGAYRAEDDGLTARLTLTPTDDHDVLLEAGAQRLSRDGTPGRTVAATAGALELETERRHLVLAHTGRWAAGTSDISVLRETIDARNTIADTITTTYPDTSLTNTVVDATFALPLPRNDLIVGGQWMRSELEGTDREAASGPVLNTIAGLSKRSWALFAEDQFHVTETLTLTGGARYDDDERYGGHWSPRGYAVWHVAEGWTVRGGMSRAFRTPELRQTAADYRQATGGATGAPRGVIPGNPALKPETSTATELGVRYDAVSGVAFGVTLFNNDFKNKIFSQCVLDCAGTAGATYAWGNIGSAVLRGVETSMTLPLTDALSLAANYTYTDSERRSDDEIAFDGSSLRGEPLDRTPAHVANVKLDWRASDALLLYARTNVQSEQYWANFRNSALSTRRRPGATTFDLGGSYALRSSIDLRAALLNVGDRQVPVDSRGRNDGLDGNWQVDEGRRLWMSVGVSF